MGIFIGMIMIYHFLMMICMRDKLSKKEIDWTDKSLHLTVFPRRFASLHSALKQQVSSVMSPFDCAQGASKPVK